MNASRDARSADLVLVIDGDAQSSTLLRTVLSRLGCDYVEADSTEGLAEILALRSPTLAVLAVDRNETAGLAVLHELARHGVRAATLLIGSVDRRVLASAKHAVEAHGMPVIAMRQRPLHENELEQLLAPHLQSPPPISTEEVEHALSEQEFSLVYQPKITLSGDHMTMQGAEALVRWNHPRRGLLTPGMFLPALGAQGQLGALTDFVMTEAVRQLGQWRTRGLDMEMVINLSPGLVHDRAFSERLAMLLRELDVPPQRIVFDVTETAGIADRDLLIEVFTSLRIQGIGLALDNFGTGVSSLTELYRLPFSELKIDHSLIKDAMLQPDAAQIVRAIVALAHTLGLGACAEGVEAPAMLEFVRDAGFDTAQGRYFSHPQPAAGFEALFAHWLPSASGASSRRSAAATSPRECRQGTESTDVTPPKQRTLRV